MKKMLVLLSMMCASPAIAFPSSWLWLWEGSENVGSYYVHSVLEIVDEKSAYLVYKLQSDDSAYVFKINNEAIVDREGYYEISLDRALERELRGELGYKLVLVPDFGLQRIMATILIFSDDKSFSFPISVKLIKVNNAKPELKIYELIEKHKNSGSSCQTC